MLNLVSCYHHHHYHHRHHHCARWITTNLSVINAFLVLAACASVSRLFVSKSLRLLKPPVRMPESWFDGAEVINQLIASRGFPISRTNTSTHSNKSWRKSEMKEKKRWKKRKVRSSSYFMQRCVIRWEEDSLRLNKEEEKTPQEGFTGVAIYFLHS